MVDFFAGEGALHKGFRPDRNASVSDLCAEELRATKRLHLSSTVLGFCR